ncbi:solute carrier family 46 member 3-like [Dreissena polymorpha]|uniref:Major facilitator superfamily (MFS) profile domain-containing protein n=1 Tax=Dreissena polymorpha TaxID=45954 RepID=A0A9D4R888_DREPO|nr:solute carrier family 46 member 3-like [Dreissena polymorpha]KAH3858706.1 hypothetical protein DPMN_101332 [Dreissena polymorpha]
MTEKDRSPFNRPHLEPNVDEKSTLLSNTDDSDGAGTTDYRKFRALEIKTTWRHWLIGPIVFAYMFAMLCSFFALVEYTNNYFMNQEYSKANISSNESADLFCNPNSSSAIYAAEMTATSEASTWNLYFALASGVPAIIANMIFGSYTDAFGRKFLLTIGIVGTTLRLGTAALIIHLELPIVFLLIACFIEGCSGQYATTLQVSLAYIADITKPGPHRMYGIIFIEVVIGIGLSLASLVSGYIIEGYGYMITFATMAGVLILNLVFMFFVLPETLSKEKRRNDNTLIGQLKASVSFFVVNDSENRLWKYRLVTVIHALCNLSYLPRTTTETLYQLGQPFCWSPTRVGTYSALRAAVILVIGLGSVKFLEKFMDEVWICIIGTASYGAAFLWTAFVTDDTSYWIIIAVGMFGPLSTTMQRSILSHLTPPEKQGAIFSVVGTLEIVCTLVANASTSYIYAATVSYMRGLVFLVLGGYDVICIILTLLLKICWSIERRRAGYKPFSPEIIVSDDT